MIKKLLFVVILSVFACIEATAGLTAHYGKVNDAYNFWFYEPDGADSHKKPLVVFLHGSSLCGNDLNRVKRYGTIAAIERGRDIDAFVIAPQNPGSSWKADKVMRIVDWAEKHYNIDKNRIYVLGMSLGGYGTIDVAASYPDRIAAAIAMCGGGTVKSMGDLNKVPLWIVHGTGDRAVSISQSDKVVAAMRNADAATPRLIYNRVPGMNHSAPARMFYMPETYEWLFKHSLTDKNREVKDAFAIHGASPFRSAYEGLTFSRSKSQASAAKSGKAYKSSKKSKSGKHLAKGKKSKKRQYAHAKSKKGKRSDV